MRKLAVLFVSISLASGLTLATAAGATVDSRVGAKTSRFCTALLSVSLPNLSDEATAKERAAATASQLNKVAKRAKGKTKRAIKVLARSFVAIADGESVKGIFSTEYVQAAATFATASLKCLVGNGRLPDISLPDNISLPGN